MTTTRAWTIDRATEARFAEATLTMPTSLLPGLTALEAAAAHAYLRTLPMRRDQSIVDAWGALDDATRDEWVERTRAVFEAVS